MNKNKLSIWFLLVIILFGFSIAKSDEFQKDCFSITLPDGWSEIPKEEITSYVEKVGRLTPNASKPHYDYAFQQNAYEEWFTFPYIFLTISNTGRIPENQLSEIEGYSIQGSVNKFQKSASSLITEMKAGKMFYDNESKIIWMRMESNIINTGLVSSICGLILTEKGCIQVMGSCMKSDLSKYEPIFQAIAMSVKPEPNLIYKYNSHNKKITSTKTMHSLWETLLNAALVGIFPAVVFAFVGVSRKFRKIKNLNTPQNNSESLPSIKRNEPSNKIELVEVINETNKNNKTQIAFIKKSSIPLYSAFMGIVLSFICGVILPDTTVDEVFLYFTLLGVYISSFSLIYFIVKNKKDHIPSSTSKRLALLIRFTKVFSIFIIPVISTITVFSANIWHRNELFIVIIFISIVSYFGTWSLYFAVKYFFIPLIYYIKGTNLNNDI